MYLQRHTTHIYGITCNLTCSSRYTKSFEQHRHNWSPIIIIIPKFDQDLVFSPRPSQSSQFSDSMPSPTTHVASKQSSQLEHPSYFCNPSLRDESNLLSLHLDTLSLPTPTRVAGGVENHPLLRLSHPPLSSHINAHALMHTLHIFYLPVPLPCPLMTIVTVVHE